MSGRQLRTVLHFLRQVSDFSSAAQQSDGQLLRRFIDRRDAAAFTVLVQRHGPLVLSVCRRVLLNPEDAEDAFQATFLVLVRKARSIARQESVGSWLHGVARRIAVRAKRDTARRRAGEQQAPRLPPPDTLHEVVWRDLREMIDEEVLRLPTRCREPFVLCYMEGRTNEEAAHLLGCPKGTVQSRLARARELLRARLARRGLVVSASLVATLLPPGAASALVPAALVDATVKAALLYAAGPAVVAGAVSSKVLVLTEGALNAMLTIKLKFAALVLAAVSVIGLAAGVPAFYALGAGQAEGARGVPSDELMEPAVGVENAAQPGVAAGEEQKPPGAAGGEEQKPPGAAIADLQTRVFPLRRTDAATARRILGALLGSSPESPAIAIDIDERTNSVVVRTNPKTLAEIGEIIQQLDKPTEKKPQPAARDELEASALLNQIKIYPLKNRTPAQIKAVLEKIFRTDVEQGLIALAVEEDTNMLIVRTAPPTQDVIGTIIERLDVGVERVPPEKKPQEPPARRPQLPEGVGPPPVAAGAPLDLVNLASAYIDAVRSLEIARLRVERVEKLKGAISNEEAATARIDLQAAERKVALLRAIAEAAYQGAQSELAAVKDRYQVGQALASQLAAAEAKAKMLKSILDSAK